MDNSFDNSLPHNYYYFDDLTIDQSDGYSTADEVATPPETEPALTVTTPSEISDVSYDGTTMPLPPKTPTTHDLVMSLLAASSTTKQLLAQLVTELKTDRGRPTLVQHLRTPKAPRTPHDPDFYDDGWSPDR